MDPILGLEDSQVKTGAMGRFAPDHPLMQFRRAVEEAFGEDLERVVLFGSRARGDARPDSDWDVAVFLRRGADDWYTLRTLSEIAVRVGDCREGMFIQPVMLDPAITNRSIELRRHIREEGIELRLA